MTAALCVAAFALSCVLTMALRAYALRRNLIDIPNHRSSHSVPVPRGGGVAIVLAYCIVTVGFAAWGLDSASVMATLAAAAFVAAVGFVDDHISIKAGWRLIAHFSAALWALAWIGGLPAIPIFGEPVDFGLLGHALAVFYLVWLLNLYNFMDGIDGIAGVEAITISCCGAFLSWRLGVSAALGDAPLILAAAVGGFLVWNFPKARIFMGDAGSGFLGFTLGAFSLLSAWQAPELLWSWLILLGVFIVDATMTLIRRMRRKEVLHEAHRSHAYQHAARTLRSHPRVTLTVGLINLVWLFPWAWAVAEGLIDGVMAVAVAYLPVAGLAWHFHAGASERQVTE